MNSENIRPRVGLAESIPAYPSAGPATAEEASLPVESGLARRIIMIALALAMGAAVAFAWWWWSGTRVKEPVVVYRVARVERGSILQTVSATGPVSAVATVNVGSQVSGNISRLHADFNDRVTAGQLIAEIEPSTYEARVVQAEGDLLMARVGLELKQVTARRNEKLFKSALLPESDYDQSNADLHQQEASVKIKEAALRSAKVDLARTQIHSPVDGVVIDRAVDVGQTVQASFAAPTLFIIAQDLRRMQITANVSEADIGGVAPGCPVSFTVDAFPGEAFSGEVLQVRNNTTITNNVVTYPAIIGVDNPELKLRPGMTANVTVLVARRDAVLRVPSAALRFHPADATPGPAKILYRAAGPVDSAGRTRGKLQAVPVKTGLSDGLFTEIESGVTEGAAIVTGIALSAASGRTADVPTNPFMPRFPTANRRP